MGDLLSKDELERHLTEGCTSEKELRRHVAALEKERDAALTDNAELTKRTNDALGLAAGLPFHGHEGDEESGQHEPDCEQCAKEAISNCLTEALAQPHPGTALLEEHRAALVRARNEGLEKAAKRLDDEAEAMEMRASQCAPFSPARDTYETARNTALRMARKVRDIKEPVSDDSAKVTG